MLLFQCTVHLNYCGKKQYNLRQLRLIKLCRKLKPEYISGELQNDHHIELIRYQHLTWYRKVCVTPWFTESPKNFRSLVFIKVTLFSQDVFSVKTVSLAMQVDGETGFQFLFGHSSFQQSTSGLLCFLYIFQNKPTSFVPHLR